MTVEDRRRWDERYGKLGPPRVVVSEPPDFLKQYLEIIPVAGQALDLACGQGFGAVWLAGRGLHVRGLDVSPIAISQARELAEHHGLGNSCHFAVVDLDDGLPPGPRVEVILCHKFRDRRLDRAVIQRLAPGGLLAISCLSEVGANPGPFRAKPGELPAAFAELELVQADEGQGCAWLLARAERDPPNQLAHIC